MNDSIVPSSLTREIARVRKLAVLTGAGMSTECGVPVFRGPGGLWEGHRPEELATPEAFAADPDKVWRWYRWRLEKVTAAEPHEGHRALARVENEARLEAFDIVTQNVDGMHQRAGNERVTELHGNLTRARCSLNCGHTVSATEVSETDFTCACGQGQLRPAVVWFGEGLSPRSLETASRVLESADMVWVVGTSSVVYPAAALPELAARRGTVVVEINPDPTPLTDLAAYSLRAPASSGVRELCRGIPA